MVVKNGDESHGRLVGGFNPSEKYARQIGSFPQIGMNIKKICHKPPTTQFFFPLKNHGLNKQTQVAKWKCFALSSKVWGWTFCWNSQGFQQLPSYKNMATRNPGKPGTIKAVEHPFCGLRYIRDKIPRKSTQRGV